MPNIEGNLRFIELLNVFYPFHSVAHLAGICQAFRAIDEKGAGYIETAKMSELLVSKGTPFRAKEIEAFLSVAKVLNIAETRVRCSGRKEKIILNAAIQHYAEFRLIFAGFAVCYLRTIIRCWVSLRCKAYEPLDSAYKLDSKISPRTNRDTPPPHISNFCPSHTVRIPSRVYQNINVPILAHVNPLVDASFPTAFVACVTQDTETGHIYFEDYVASLATDG